MFYVKTEKGILRLATQDEILGNAIALYDAEGNEVRQASDAGGDPPAPVGNVLPIKSTPMDELTDLIKSMVTKMGNVQEKVEQQEQQIAAFNAATKNGWPMAKAEPGATPDEQKAIFAPYNLAKQGQRLVDKLSHPGCFIADDVRQEMAKYYISLLKVGAKRTPDPRDVVAFNDMYGQPTADQKTALGDTGNVFPVPDIVDAEILHFAREVSVVLQYARMWEMTSEKQSFPVESAGVTVAWGNTTANSDPTVAEFELDAEELSAYSIVRNTTLADSRSDIVSWLHEMMAEAAGLELDNVAFNGDGTSTYANCSGLLTAACGYSIVMASGSTAFSSMTGTTLSSMIAKLDGLKKQGARWWLHGEVLHFVRDLKDTNNRPIFTDTIGSPVPGTIWGYPYSETIKMVSTSAANTAYIVFGNLKYFGIGKRLGSTALSVDPYGLWTTNRTRFKIYQRWGLGIALGNGFVRLVTAAE